MQNKLWDQPKNMIEHTFSQPQFQSSVMFLKTYSNGMLCDVNMLTWQSHLDKFHFCENIETTSQLLFIIFNLSYSNSLNIMQWIPAKLL